MEATDADNCARQSVRGHHHQSRGFEAGAVDRQGHQWAGGGFPHLRQRRQVARGATRHRRNEAARVPSGYCVQPRRDPAVMRPGLSGSSDVSAGRGVADGLPRRRRGHARARRQPAPHSRPVSRLRRGAPLGRPHAARRAAACVPALARSEPVMSQVRSKDGTTIAYERSGSGPPLILVDGALCSRAFGPSPKLAPLLARHFAVYVYDRRGRGESGDTPPYSPAREVEDIAALIEAAGGSASLLGLSSGGALALEAAASGLSITKVVAYEPPYVDDAGQRGGDAHEAELRNLLARGNRGGAVTYFMKDMVGAPAPVVVLMRLVPWVWRKLKAVAHTLPYDASVMTQFRIPRARFAAIATPTLVMHGSKTDDRLKNAARMIAAVVPGARHRELAGQTHNVKPAVLTP